MMTPVKNAFQPYVLIVDADRGMREMLSETVLGAHGDARLDVCENGEQAAALLQERLPDLVLATRELPGFDGLELLRTVRQKRSRPAVPFILMSSRGDAASVREAVPLAPTAYLTTPLDTQGLRQRLQALLRSEDLQDASPASPASPGPSLQAFLNSRREQADGGPLRVNVRAVVQASRAGEGVDEKRLEQGLRYDPHATAVLIAAANSAGQHGRAVLTLTQAIATLGPVQSANLVLGLVNKAGAVLSDPMLRAEAERFWTLSQRTARYAALLARKLELKPELCHCAGLLLCIGDLTVLRCLQEWVQVGGVLDDAAMRHALEEHAAPFGSALRTRWRLPLPLRELISAGYQYNMGSSKLDILAMNLAGLMGRAEGEEGMEAIARSKPARLLKLGAEELDALRQAASH